MKVLAGTQKVFYLNLAQEGEGVNFVRKLSKWTVETDLMEQREGDKS